MLKRLYEKSKLWFAIMWIILYCVLMSLADNLSVMLGVNKLVTLIVGLALSAVILIFLFKNNLFAEYGLCPPRASAHSMLYYLPPLVMLTANLWGGVSLNPRALEALLFVLSMLLVGFLEEIIFRGFLFEAMRGENITAAVIVSSVTFGIGHIINLINGSGAELLPNLLQLVYATAAGFMFIMMYYRSGSLISSIIAHGAFNALSLFSNEASLAIGTRILTALLLTLITGSYALYLALAFKRKKQ